MSTSETREPRLTGTLLDRVAHWADERPDAMAMEFAGQRYTWAEWHERLLRLVGALTEAGIGEGDTVAFVDKNHLGCLEVTHASSALGAANAVPNWRLADDELVYVLGDAGATIVFAGAEFRDTIDRIRDRLPTVERVITVGGDDDGYEAFLTSAAPHTPPEVSPDQTALLLFSSGTTGRPKGVKLTHRNLAAHSEAVIATLPFTDGDVLLVPMPLFHVGGTSFALVGIHDGRPCVIAREADAPSLFAGIQAGANVTFVVPAVIGAVANAGEQAIAAFSRLRRILYGAAPMPLPLLRTALAAWPETEFAQVYGMTELAGVITCLLPEVHRDPTQIERMGSAGTPIPGVEMRVVEPHDLSDVAPGELGELWWRSTQTTPGYWRNEEATAETIVEGGWLRSGDIGRVDDGGFVFIEDRLKDMIITGGENVYSPEVERVLIEHPDVAEVAVIGVPSERWGETIKAVVVPLPDREIDEQALIDYTREHLARFKCPTSVDIVDELPRNPTGKILKRTLRQPYWEDR